MYRNNRSIVSIVESVGFQNVAISDVTRAEMLVGTRNKQELKTYIKELRLFNILPIEADISLLAVELIETFYSSHGLDFHDALIAATAIYHGLSLYTLNVKDFVFIPDINLFKP
jgi:predicted nucleic acid-binding protein